VRNKEESQNSGNPEEEGESKGGDITEVNNKDTAENSSDGDDRTSDTGSDGVVSGGVIPALSD
jgi:hypothetical protein